MAGLQRFVSYIFKYENDEKMENAGFARIEIRGNAFKITLHIQNISTEQPEAAVYIFSRNGENIQGISIGKIRIEKGSGDIQRAFNIKELSEFGVTLGDLEGIFIPIADRAFLASQWKEGNLSQEGFRVMEKKKAEESEDSRQREGQNIKEGQPDNPENLKEEQAGNLNGTRTGRLDESKASGSEEREELREGWLKRQGESEKKRSENEESAGTKQPIQATELPQEALFAEKEAGRIFQKFRMKSGVFFPFEGEALECVRMQLNDLQELPKKYWYLGKNSFLLHGFFNYRHIILGEMEEDGAKEYFIGVPGVFQNQERVMASIFGFPEFRTAKNTEYKTGNFGYWYRII